MTSPPPDKPLFSFSHANRLRIGCEHIDKLLGEIEGIMHESSSNTAFPRYLSDLTPSQSTCIEDHISLIRSRLLSIIECSGIKPDKPDIPASRAVRVRLASIQVSVDELRPQAMRSFGPMEEEGEIYLSGVVSELRILVKQAEQFLTGIAGQNIRMRLLFLEQGAYDTSLLNTIENLISDNGLVEFRPALASILDQIEDQTFEIAVFGRVSSGKSSLLNAIIGEDILPVGVTPVTALPIHIRWGKDKAIEVSFADKKPLTGNITELPLYATEQQNPANRLHVTRITVSIPGERLRNGIGFADTPGLGSLATTGAAETYAYLPSCDLGIVLVDAGSTLTTEDIHTVIALQQAAIPVQILVSKADILSESDQSSLTQYISAQIHARCNEWYPVRPVSIKDTHRYLLDRWYESDILPLVMQARERKERSLRRKVALLQGSVQDALDEREGEQATVSPERREEFRKIETILRNGSARIEQFRNRWSGTYDIQAPDLAPLWIVLAKIMAGQISEANGQKDDCNRLMRDTVIQYIHAAMKPRYEEISALASDLRQILITCAAILNTSEIPDTDDLSELIRDMPIFDPGPLEFSFSMPILSSVLGKQYLENTLKQEIRDHLKSPLKDRTELYARMYGAWLADTISDLEKVYESKAGQYRATIGRRTVVTE